MITLNNTYKLKRKIMIIFHQLNIDQKGPEKPTSHFYSPQRDDPRKAFINASHKYSGHPNTSVRMWNGPVF